nr:phage tail protein [Acinetobacter colistiniresistens]
MEFIKGSKKGKKKARKPRIAPDSAQSITYIKALYGLAEGEIKGLTNGHESVYLESTPLLDANKKENFSGVKVDFRPGTNDQEYIQGFPAVESETAIDVELTDKSPWVRAFKNLDLDAVRIRFKWGPIYNQNMSNGDVNGYTIHYAIDLQTDGGQWNEVLNTKISDKTSANYERGHKIELPAADSGWQIRVRRITPNKNSTEFGDKMSIAAITEIIDAKLRYPNTALLSLEYDAETFSNTAKVSVDCEGKIIRVPSNYSAVSRTYTGIWDGTFIRAYSNNPAWIYYDACVEDRYGLGERLTPLMIDKWSLYRLGQYCDEMVPDGQGGKEPRFTCNVYLQKDEDAYSFLVKLAGVFRAISYWDGNSIICDADIPQDTYFAYSRANVIDGNFEYTGTRARDRHNVVKVAWDNPDNHYKTEYEFVRDEKAIGSSGQVRILDLDAWGCTSRGQAQRAGQWALKSEQLETRTATFKVGLDGHIPLPGKIIEISDELFAGRANGGRVAAVSQDQKSVTLDRDEVLVKAGDKLVVNGEDGRAQTRIVQSVSGRTVTVTEPFKDIAVQNVWVLNAKDLATMKFRVISIREEEKHQFTITALQYNASKFDAIDHSAHFDDAPISIVNPGIQEPVSSVEISSKNHVEQGLTITTMVITWQQAKGAVKYQVEWRKNDGSWIKVPVTGNNSLEVTGVYAGTYQARVIAISAFEDASLPVYSIITDLKGKQGLPPKLASITASGILFGMQLNWLFPNGADDTAYIEIEVSPDGKSNISLLGLFAYPTTTTTIQGLQGNLSQNYRGRLIDRIGNKGEWSEWAKGTSSADPEQILEILENNIGKGLLDDSLRKEIESISEMSNTLADAKRTIDETKKAVEETRSETNQAINELITDINAETKTRLEQVAQLKEGITQSQNTADNAISTVNDYKLSNEQAIANIRQNANVAIDNSNIAIQKADSITGRLNNVETNSASALNKAQIAIDATSANATDIRALNSSISTKAETGYVNQVKTLAEITEGKVNANTAELKGINSRVGNNEANINSINQTKANKDEVASIAQQALQSTWQADTQAKVDAMVIGARNLILDSYVGEKANSGYPFFSRKLTQTLKEGEIVTATVWGELESGTYMAIYNSGGLVDMAVLNYLGNRMYRVSFAWKIGNSANKWIDIYAVGHKEGGYSVVDKVMLERGNKGTDWIAAPEDLKIGARNLVRNTGKKHHAFGWVFQELLVKPIKGKVTISFDAKSDDGVVVGGGVGFNKGDKGASGFTYFWYPMMGDGRVSATFDVDSSGYTHFGIYVNTPTTITNLMVEQGTIPTTWQPAPEDQELELTEFKSNVTQTYQTKADAASTTATLTQQLNSKASVAQARDQAADVVNGTNIGGENLLTGTQYFRADGNVQPNYAGFGDLVNGQLWGTNTVYTTPSAWRGFKLTGFPENKLQEDCVLSFWARSTTGANVAVYSFTTGMGIIGTVAGTEWKQYSFKFPRGALTVNDSNNGFIEFDPATNGTAIVYGAIQLQLGNKSTRWQASPKDIHVGGRNLLRNSEFKQDLKYWTIYDSNYSFVNVDVNNVPTRYIYLSGGTGGLYMQPRDIPYVAKEGDVMTLSFSARGEGTMVVGFDDANVAIPAERNGELFKRYVVTMRRKKSDNVIMYIRGGYVDLLHPKLELGNVATEWTPAPEDIQNEVSEFRAEIVNNYSTKADLSSAVASGITDYNAQLGNLKTFMLSALGSNYNGFAGLRDSRTNILHRGARSYSIHLFNENGDWQGSDSYDVYGDAPSSDALAKRILAQPTNYTIAITSYDEPAGGRTSLLRDAFLNIGGTQAAFDNLPFRGAYILVGRRNLGEGGGIEVLNLNGIQSDLPLQFVNGRPVGLVGNKPEVMIQNAQANVLTQTQAKVTDHEGRISSLAEQTTTLTSNVTNAQNTANQARQEAELLKTNKDEIVDLTDPRYNRDKWYPVGIGTLSSIEKSTIQIFATLDGGSKPNWCTHAAGFSLNIIWKVMGEGWGTISSNRVVTDLAYGWTVNNVSPVQRLAQFGASSTEIIWLRGGAKYRARIPKQAGVKLPNPDNGILTDPFNGETIGGMPYDVQYMPKTTDAKTDTNTVTLQQQAKTIDGVTGMWTVKVDNNGVISGFGMVSEVINGQVRSQFGVNADTFFIGNPHNGKKPFIVNTTPQKIGDTLYPAGTYIDSAFIAAKTIKTDHLSAEAIDAVAVKARNVTITSPDGSKTVQEGGLTEMFYPGGTLAVRIGIK